MVIHINPIQEFIQPEGDSYMHSPIELLDQTLDLYPFPVIVKEVGQGMGPESIKQLLSRPIEALELAAYGGTNFAQVELLRGGENQLAPLKMVGHTAIEMINIINHLLENEKNIKCKNIIASGGVKSFLDGYYFTQLCQMPTMYGMASRLLKYSQGDYGLLKDFFEKHISGLKFASKLLRIKTTI